MSVSCLITRLRISKELTHSQARRLFLAIGGKDWKEARDVRILIPLPAYSTESHVDIPEIEGNRLLFANIAQAAVTDPRFLEIAERLEVELHSFSPIFGRWLRKAEGKLEFTQ